MFSQNHRAMLMSSIIAICLAAISCSRGDVTTVSIVNRSSETIDTCVIRLNKDEVRIQNLRIGNTSPSNQLTVKADASYNVTVRFHGGRQLHQQIGYVTSGFNYKDTLIIYDNRIDLAPQVVLKK